MDDLEMTGLCAEAMGHRRDKDGGYSRLAQGAGMDEPQWFEFIYDPLHDDAQAMALLERFRLAVSWDTKWCADGSCHRDNNDDIIYAENLNRAIVECVANLQSSFTAPPQ